MKLVIVGCAGHWGIAAEAVLHNPAYEVTAIAPGCPEENIDSLSIAFPKARVYKDWQTLFSAEKADCAIVNPWFALASAITCAALCHGMNVYSEKPLAVTHAQLQAVEMAWHESGHALGGMFNYRYSPWFLAMEEAIEKGEIGDIRLIHGQKSYRMGVRPEFYKKRELMGGIIPWVAIHAIDWVCAFGGDCQWVSAGHSRGGNRGNGDMEASSAILMGMEQEILATVTADFFRPNGSARHDDDRLRITGTHGMIEAVDGRVFLENTSSKKELSLPPMVNAFEAFCMAVENGQGNRFAQNALYATHISLLARDSADQAGVRIQVQKENQSPT